MSRIQKGLTTHEMNDREI